MFTSAAQAARIDAGEATLCAAVARVIDGSSIVPLAGGLAVLSRPGAPINKIAGVGFGAALESAALDEVEASWRERGEAVRFEIGTLADPDVFRALTARGYRLDGFEHVLGRPLAVADGAPTLPPGVTVERVTDATSELWLDVSADGFSVPDGSAPEPSAGTRDALRALFSDFGRASEVPRYLARVDGAPAGVASVRFADGLAQLCGATTLPGFRRRGVQRALLLARLADAVAAGCDLAVVTTSPGSQSQANVSRAGFQLLYARAVLIR